MERRHARSGSPYEDTIGFSRAVRVGSTVAVSGTAPVWPDGQVDPDPAVQARRCWEIVVAALEELGASVHDVVRTRQYVVRADVAEAVGAVPLTDTVAPTRVARLNPIVPSYGEPERACRRSIPPR